jgi:hypothetical protein
MQGHAKKKVNFFQVPVLEQRWCIKLKARSCLERQIIYFILFR